MKKICYNSVIKNLKRCYKNKEKTEMSLKLHFKNKQITKCFKTNSMNNNNFFPTPKLTITVNKNEAVGKLCIRDEYLKN